MKKGYLLVVAFWLIVDALFAQGSWVNVAIQTDNYAGETSWEIVQNSEVVAVSPPLLNSTLQNHTVFLPSGEYNFIIYDSFGDGICCGFGEGWYSLTNNCGLEIFDYEFGSASATTFFELEPCLPILPGCMDETANNYNPWATLDDESCSVTGCPEGEAFVSMELTLDTWPSETGFTIVDISNGQALEYAPPYGFDFGDQLVTYTYNFCSSLGFELILTDVYGDGLNGSASGGEDGACIITACGDSVLWELEDLAFEEFGGGTMYSGAIFTEPCPPIPPVVGCMDDDYIDYNPLAEAQGACETLHTWGCMDPESFNYDSLATTSDLNGPCAIEIMIEDDGGDGWGNSKLGMVQGAEMWLFTMGPGSFSESWNIMLDSDEEVYMYYFQEGGAQQSAQELAFQTLHNSVLVTNAAGDTLLSEGVNPFFNNGQGALQPFAAPEWNVYSFTPYCGDSCEPYTYGCIDETAQNYNAEVNTEDGSCYYQSGCTQAGYLEYYTQGYEADYDNGSCDILAVFGCTDEEAFNYNPEANVDNEGCVPVVEGCTNQLAFNYLSSANVDDGSCEPYVYGCIDPTAFNFNDTANTDDESCIPVVFGCTDSTQFNYDPNANTDNESCVEYIYGCTDSVALNFNALANTDDDSCIPVVLGCTDPEAFNYNESANVDDDGCVAVVLGCTNQFAFNYLPSANVDDNSCIPYIYGCTDPAAFNYDSTANVDDGECEPFVYGCTNDTMFNFNPLANAEYSPSDCVPFIYGCTDPTMLNYDSSANTEDFSCIPYVYGCTDPLALNYDPDANTDNDSCIEVVIDCMDPNAFNYNELANTSNEDACLYDAGCIGEPGVPYWYNDSCYAWIIDIDPYCCEVAWDGACVELYDYCEAGWPTGVYDIHDIYNVYPNPVTDILNIQTSLDIITEVYNVFGQLVVAGTREKRIDLSRLPKGFYEVVIKYNERTINKKIIKS